MATELERLKAWMQENGYSIRSLAKVTGFKYNSLYKMISDRRHISAGFQVRFGARFGFDLAFSIFDSVRTKRPAHPLAEQKVYPGHYAARRAVAQAIYRKELSPAKEHKCCTCSKQAAAWHHPSYHPDDRLNVVPLCRNCHAKVHAGKLDIPSGVVPTSVGLIRIAIVTAPEQL